MLSTVVWFPVCIWNPGGLIWVMPPETLWLEERLIDRGWRLLVIVSVGGAVYGAVVLSLGGRIAHLTHRA